MALLFVLAVYLRAQDPAEGLATEDRLRVREAQLALQQYNVDLLQAQLNLRNAQDALSKLVEDLRTKYSRGGCQLNNALQFVCPPKGESNGMATKPPEKDKEKEQ